MQNEMMDLMKQFNDNAMGSAKRFGELNMKTFETLTAKQSELMNACFESGTKSFEAMSKAKDPQQVLELQQETMKACGEKWMNSAREAVDMMTATRDELAAIAEEAAEYTTVTAEKATELNKQAANEGMEKVTETVEKAMAKATEMTKDVADKTVEATKKAAAEAKVAA